MRLSQWEKINEKKGILEHRKNLSLRPVRQAAINCGVAAVYGATDASHLVYLSLYALQHRGQESAGIVSVDGQRSIARSARVWSQMSLPRPKSLRN
jgi:hypothetical protein